MKTSCLARFILTVFMIALCMNACSRPAVDQNSLDQQLLAAVKSGNASEVQQLLRRGARAITVHERDETALDVATLQGEGDIIPLLLTTKIDTASLNKAVFEAAGNQPAVLIAQSDVGNRHHDPKFFSTTELVNLFLDKGADIEAVNEEYDTPLIQAAAHGGTEVVKLLLERGAAIEARDGVGLTALNAAACLCAVIDMPDTLDIVRMLLQKGADIETRDDAGETPLIRASGWGRTEIVELLLDERANIEARDKDGNTALLVSSKGGAMPTADVVKLLLDRKSMVEAKNQEGKTALMLAATENGSEQIKIVKLLLIRGADIRGKDKHGNTALSLAEKSDRPDINGNHPELIKLLKSAMAASQ